MLRLLFLFICFLTTIFSQEFLSSSSKTTNFPYLCTTGDRSAVCTEEIKTVCGWFSPEFVQCFVNPCAAEYSNICLACNDPKVYSISNNLCPKF